MRNSTHASLLFRLVYPLLSSLRALLRFSQFSSAFVRLRLCGVVCDLAVSVFTVSQETELLAFFSASERCQVRG